MKFFLSGYYGYDNAGDEAVLAAILSHLDGPGREFVVTSGDPEYTLRLHGQGTHKVRAIPRQSLRALLGEIRGCDVFLSGGGSLLQDVTSLRNIFYYTLLLRLAQLLRKPTMIYAQGIGPLLRPKARKLARVAVERCTSVTLRDEDSAALLREVGVRRELEVTADPVWALEPGIVGNWERGDRETWCVSLRSWLGESEESSKQEFERIAQAVRAAADKACAKLRFLPMQPARDRALMEPLLREGDEIIETAGMHPRDIMAQAGQCDRMIAMRLHALIFAAAQGVPCVAISYDPKVASLAKAAGMPVVGNTSDAELAKLEIVDPPAPTAATVAEFKRLALLNAERALTLGR